MWFSSGAVAVFLLGATLTVQGSALNQSLTQLSPCPGRYCGRVPSGESFSECGACPRAHRTDGFICKYCDGEISTYEILFLSQIVVIFFIFQQAFLASHPSLIAWTRFFIGSIIILFEVLIACFAAVLLENPVGSLHLDSCGMTTLSDWYPYLYNPRPTYTYTLHCANEAAYPLITWILIFCTFDFIISTFIRFPIFYKLKILTGNFDAFDAIDSLCRWRDVLLLNVLHSCIYCLLFDLWGAALLCFSLHLCVHWSQLDGFVQQ